MNASEYDSLMNMTYDYDYNSSCDQNLSPALSGRPMVLLVLYYMLFCFGLLGMLKKQPGCQKEAKKKKYIQYNFTLIIKYDFTGNTTVLWVLLRHIKLKTMTDTCLLNLALSDLMLAVSLPLWAYNSQNLDICKLMTGVYQVGLFISHQF